MLILSYEHPMVLMQLSVVGCRVLGADLKGKGQWQQPPSHEMLLGHP